ncbi:uncharacterized protein LOC114841665 [Diachasma alloeum]|uniref:uncharacterized protein LOC114841665 n=1 Tax=Diachasma alloeum TaxID=454923 RepID=UPI0010FB736B|nr:uncharacterized protein LOC114841665 [Diachasma alloeum]
MITAQELALRSFKLSLGATWKDAAKALGITERAILSYIAEPGTKGYREMPTDVWQRLEERTGHSLLRNTDGLYFPQKKIISVSSQKGGVGKTTIAAAIAAVLARMGYKTLVIDMDPQGNLTEQYYQEDDEFPAEILPDPDGDDFKPGPAHIWNMFEDENAQIEPLKREENLYLIGSSLDLADIQLGDTKTLVSNFYSNLKRVESNFDLVILDTLPSFGNALAAAHRSADWLVIPTELARFSKKGIVYQLKTAMNTKLIYDTELTLLGIVVNKINYTSRKEDSLVRIQDNYRKLLMQQYGDHIVSPAIKTATQIVEAQSLAQPLLDYAPNQEITLQFTLLTQELLRRIKHEEGYHG